MSSRAKSAKRARGIVVASLGIITGLAWLVTFNMNASMMMPASPALLFVLWIVMMVAMMTPSVLPTLLMFVRILDSRGENPFAPGAVFVLGYLLVWSSFSAAATLAQLALMPLISTAALFGGLVLVAAGVFQLTPLKQACLRQCRSPQGFFMTEWREGARGTLVMGLNHGAFCLGCCWLLMALMFVVGATNVLWMAAIAIFVLAEKVAPAGVLLSYSAGLVLVGAGAWIILGALI
jgi:predicted metal-binding membrane protein